jgi:rubrerythrin
LRKLFSITEVKIVMWMCTNCRHLEVTETKPEHCAICGADAGKIIQYEAPKVKGSKTLKHLQEGFAAESKAQVRDLAFAIKAEQDGYPQLAGLFRAIAESEGVHAFHHLRFLGAVADTQENLQAAFERENFARDTYPEFIKDANEEGNPAIATIFGYHRDVEREHAKLYEKALDRMLDPEGVDYYVCEVCGYVAIGSAPDNCPICNAPKDKFRKVS